MKMVHIMNMVYIVVIVHGNTIQKHQTLHHFVELAENPNKQIELFLKDIMKGAANVINFGNFYFCDGELVPPKFSIYFFQAKILTRCKKV